MAYYIYNKLYLYLYYMYK